MATIIDPPNSVWPNGLKVDSEGYAIFYPLGTNKVDISTITWPDGYKLISPYVYDENDKIVGFVDTKALTVSGAATTTMNYSHIEANFASISEGKLTVNAPNAVVKKFRWAVSAGSDETFDFVIIDFNTTDAETINTVRTAQRVVDNKLYAADDSLIGTIDTSKIEIGGIIGSRFTKTDGLFYNLENQGLILSEFNSDLSSLRDGSMMFAGCTVTSFTGELSSMTEGRYMFSYCDKLTSFSSDMSSLIYGVGTFLECSKLTSFSSNLSSLENGSGMFQGCKLDTASIQNIADTINDITSRIPAEGGSWPATSGRINISIGNSTPNDQEKAAFNEMVSKGWNVYVNGSRYSPSSVSSVMTLDELGNEVKTPIPYYAKPVPATEETASYVDANGNFFNIVGAQFIYGDDLSTYGMFTCEADAAANMRLTKIEKGDK